MKKKERKIMSNLEMIHRVIWQPDEYKLHRIPGIIVTSRGTVIIYNESRREGKSDWDTINIVMQRSTDGANTFGEPIILVEGTDEFKTSNNPVMVEDKNGRLHLLYCRDYTVNGGGAWHRFSDDDGLTWSEPDEVTYATRPELHNVFAFGPGHAICTSDGTLLVPIWMVLKEASVAVHEHMPSVISTFYSKDNGVTWQMGEIIPSTEEVKSPNETVAVELSDGRIMLDIRSFTHMRSKSFSENGTDGWSVAVNDEARIDPGCFGSIIRFRDGERYRLLAVNCNDDAKRRNITLYVSDDNGMTWSIRRTVDAERGGYVDIAADEKRGVIYILYEQNWGKYVFLCRMTKDLLDI